MPHLKKARHRNPTKLGYSSRSYAHPQELPARTKDSNRIEVICRAHPALQFDRI